MEGKVISESLLEILACPACDCRPAVELLDGHLCCGKCGRKYPIENGIPIMLVDKAIGGGEQTQ